MSNTINTKLYHKILRYFELCDTLNFSQIKKLLSEDKIEVSDLIIKSIINDMHTKYHIIARHDYLGKESIYELLSRQRQGRKDTDRFYSFSDFNCEDKTIVLISDLHLGNPKYEDYRLLNQIYRQANVNNDSAVLVLGDMFDKAISSSDKLSKTMNDFVRYYPNGRVPTFVLMGNHEKQIDYDFRKLMPYKPNLIVFNRDSMLLQTGDDFAHLSHKLYFNTYYDDIRLNSINEFESAINTHSESTTNDYGLHRPDYRINISGHLHEAFIKTLFDNYVFIGVPSTSKINSGKCVSYKLNLHYKDYCLESIEIVPVYYIENVLEEGESFMIHLKDKARKLVGQNL